MSEFIRQIEVLIGPLKEVDGGNGENAIRIFSDGSQDQLRISCSIQKSIISIPNVSTVTLYNLSEDTRSMLRTPGISIVVNAGWQTGQMHQIFKGGVLGSFSERIGTEIVTKIMALTGGDALAQSQVNLTFSANTSVTAAVIAMATTIKGVTVDPVLIQITKNDLSSGGFSFAGDAKGALDKLGLQYGFSWSIQDGVFQAIDDKKTFGNVLYLNGDDGTLINITPLLAGPMQAQIGTKIKSFLVPAVSPGNQVSVNSTVNKWMNGTYKIHTIEMKADTFSNDWNMDIQSFKTF